MKFSQRKTTNSTKKSTYQRVKSIYDNVVVAKSEDKNLVLGKLNRIIENTVIPSRHYFCCGVNIIFKKMRLNLVRSVCLARDASVGPPYLHIPLVEAAMLRSIPILVLPKSTEALAHTFKLKNCTCFAILHVSYISNPDNIPCSKEETLKFESHVDDLNEFIVSLSCVKHC
jgi:hypothetical protein